MANPGRRWGADIYLDSSIDVGAIPYKGANGKLLWLTPGAATQVLTSNGATPNIPSYQAGGGGGGGAAFAGARVYNSVNISIANNTETALTFDSERFDTDSFHSTSTNTGRITIPSGNDGKYLISANTNWASNATGQRLIILRINGTTQIGVQGYNASSGGGETYQEVASLFDLAVGDYVEVTVYQNSGGSLNVLKNGSYSPEFWVAKLG